MIKHLLSVTMASVLLVAQASAHARLRSSTPAAGATLPAAPPALELHFNEKVRLASVVLSSGGKEIPVAVEKTAAPSADASLRLPALAAGDYVVAWRALSGGDGHVIHGNFTFSIGGAAKP
jgi:copper resistance protein C